MTSEDLHTIQETFYTEYSKLVAATLDKLSTPEEAAEFQYRIADISNPFGCGWEKHSTKFRIKTFAEILQDGKPRPR